MSKKFIISSVVIVVFLIAGAAYYFLLGGEELVSGWLGGKTGPEAVTTTNSPDRPGEEGQMLLLSKRLALSPALSLSGGTVWYFDTSGQLYRAKLDGTEDVSYGLTTTVPIQRAFWPLAGNDFIVNTSREGAAPFRYYNSATAQFIDLPANVWELAWLPSGKQIVYIWRKADGKMELQIADPDAKNFSKLADLSVFYSLKTPASGDYVLLEENYSTGAPNKVLKFDLAAKTLSPLLDRGRNFGLLPSPDGSKLLFTRANETTLLPELWLGDLKANTFQNLQIVTAINKVVWSPSGDKFYYAFPQSVNSGDFAVTGQTADTLYFYDLASSSGMKLEPKGLATPDMRDLILAENEQTLIFRNGVNGRLYKISLK
jgi:hypothetical protein